MRTFKHLNATAAAIAVVTVIAFATTSAVAAVGNGGPGARGGDANQAYPTQDTCMQSPASTSYTPCWNNG